MQPKAKKGKSKAAAPAAAPKAATAAGAPATAQTAQFDKLMVFFSETRSEMEAGVASLQAQCKGLANQLHVTRGPGGLKGVKAVNPPMSAEKWLVAALKKAGLASARWCLRRERRSLGSAKRRR